MPSPIKKQLKRWWPYVQRFIGFSRSLIGFVRDLIGHVVVPYNGRRWRFAKYLINFVQTRIRCVAPTDSPSRS